jgi:hypothetical protein
VVRAHEFEPSRLFVVCDGSDDDGTKLAAPAPLSVIFGIHDFSLARAWENV